jgi:hypothetical protein
MFWVHWGLMVMMVVGGSLVVEAKITVNGEWSPWSGFLNFDLFDF